MYLHLILCLYSFADLLTANTAGMRRLPVSKSVIIITGLVLIGHVNVQNYLLIILQY